MTEESFPDAVAARSGWPVAEVAKSLSDVRIPTTDLAGRPHRLRITRLAFTGKKAGVLTDDIDFDRDFTDGLWAVSSEKNDAGKTSLLEIIMWCLRGQPKRLQDDVRMWLDSVTLEGSVDHDAFVVTFDLADGELTGSLTCGSDVRPFASEAAFADTMSGFMMERLGFEAFTLWVNGQGTASHHWPSYSTVLYLPREAEGAVIGDTPGSGVVQRLVQLFIGVPWARTYSACQAALREAQAGIDEQRSEGESIQQITARAIGVRTSELESINVKLAALSSDLPSDEQIARAKTRWMQSIADVGSITTDMSEAERSHQVASDRASHERKRLTDITEAALARRLFHGLDPSRCPRCSTDIGSDRKQGEKETHSCAVCDRVLDVDLDVGIDELSIATEDADEIASPEQLEQLVSDLESAATTEQERALSLARELDTLAEQVKAAESVVESYTAQTAEVEERRTLEIQAVALSAVISELKKLADDAPAEPQPKPEDEGRLEILQAALDEATQRRRQGFEAIEDQVNAAILDLSQRFGFTTLQSAKLNMAAQLRLVKGGANTSFSKQTPGEKLRLRIAVVVALLRVAHNLDVGRHPGLLLIDSIGAEETEPGNLAEFMRELEAITAELGIQTIVASARPEILAHVPVDHRVTVAGDDYLW